jgi:dCMP deaminase
MRKTIDEYFIDILQVIKERSTCIRRSVGAVIVKDKQIIATGYNGAPAGIEHCINNENGCLRHKLNIPSGQRAELCIGVHAEQNAIIQCAKNGVSCLNATLYCTNKPCSICMKLIINAGIKRVIYIEDYEDTLTDKLILELKDSLEVIKYTSK